MIGTSKLLMTGAVANPDYAVYLTPAFISTIAPNGGYTSPLVASEVVGGSGNYTYLWEVVDGDFSITNETGSSTQFKSGGFNFEQQGSAKLTVTDLGNGNAETTQTIELIVNFGGV